MNVRRLQISAGCMAAIAVAGLLLLQAVRGGREQAYSSLSHGNMVFVSHALMRYREKTGAFPSAYITGADSNRPLHSWRVLILKSLGETDLAEVIRLDQPWDSPVNHPYWNQVPANYRCPSTDADGQFANTTSYLAIVDDREISNSSPRIAPRIVMIVDIGESATCWMAPRDLPLSEAIALFSNIQHPHHQFCATVDLRGELAWPESITYEELLNRLKAL